MMQRLSPIYNLYKIILFVGANTSKIYIINCIEKNYTFFLCLTSDLYFTFDCDIKQDKLTFFYKRRTFYFIKNHTFVIINSSI